MAAFSITQFSSALSALVAKNDERADALASWLSASLEAAAMSWLLEGSDALSQALGKIEACGKSSAAVKLRKVIRAIEFEFCSEKVTYGRVAGFNHVPDKDLIGGNSPRVSDHAQREDACKRFGDTVRTVARVLLTPPAREGEIDPLASFGRVPKEATLLVKLAAASDQSLKDAATRVKTLLELLHAEEAARAAASTDEAARAASAKAEEAARAAASTDEAARAASAKAEEAAQAAAASAAVESLTTRAKRTTKRTVNE